MYLIFPGCEPWRLESRPIVGKKKEKEEKEEKEKVPEAGTTPQAPRAQKAAARLDNRCQSYHGRYQFVSMDNVFNYGCLLIYK